MEIMLMKDPLFAPNDLKVANVSISVTPSGMACTAELYLSKDVDGATKDATSGQVTFITMGTTQQLALPIVMPNPLSGQSYRVFLIISSGGVILRKFKAADDIVIPVVGTPTINW